MLITLVVTQALVSFSGPAEPASRLLPKLGAAMGLRLEAWGRAGQQVLLINVKGLDRDRLLRLVSETSGGIWEKIEGGQKLTLDSDRLKALWKRETEDRQTWIGSAIKTQLVDPDLKPVATAALTVGPVELAAIRPGQRVAWSTSPTRLQRQAPAAVLKAGEFLCKQSLHNAEQKDRLGGGYGDAISALSTSPSVVLVMARRGLHTDSLGLSLAVFGSDGKTIVQKICQITPPPPPLDPQISAAGTILLPTAVNDWVGRVTMGKPIPDALFESLLRPEKAEPLSLGAGPVLAAYAAAGKADIVGCLPDQAYKPSAALIYRELPAEKWKPYFTDWGLNLRLDKGTIVATPLDPAQAAEDRADRAEMRRQVDAYAINGGLPATFEWPSGLEADYLSTIDNGFEAELEEDLSRPLLRSWWAFSPAERTQATAPGGVALTPPFLNELRRVMEDPTFPTERSLAYSLSLEPTVFFANIRQPAGVLRAVIQTEEVALIQEPGARIPYSAALADIASSMGAADSSARMRNPKTRFWPARTNRLTLTMAISGTSKFQMSASVRETIRSSSQAWTYPNLFPALKQAIRNGSGG